VARVELSAAAVEDLDRLIRSHSLPGDTKERLKRSLHSLERLPLLGASLEGAWSGFRFVLGPWRWMIPVYVHLEADARVVIVTIQDGRASPFA
jgi:hypothetical protein